MKKSRLLGGLFALCLLVLAGCRKSASPAEYMPKASNPERYNACLDKLTQVVIHDIFSPPVASRIYGYATLAGYEAMAPFNANYESLSGKMKGFSNAAKPEAGQEYCYPIAGAKAFLTVARALTFSANFYDEFEPEFYKQFETDGVPEEVRERSMAYGEAVAKNVLEFAAKDHYKQTRGFKHTVTNEDGTWVPTPPAYMDAAEPKWNNIRCWTMDTCNQFMPPRPYTYSMAKGSPYEKEVMEVYETGKKLTKEQNDIAYFWDDNAFVMNVAGHVMYASKKMTPGGHWLGIAQTVGRQQKLDLMRMAEAYVLTSFALADGFIACWDEKYRSKTVRPETVINKSIDPKWAPFLQTPPFPEYPSGHSTISAAAATVLTQLMGDSIAFTDSTEYKYGHGVRAFKSFNDAANEASVSRLYGGIHYRSALDNGAAMGMKVGQHVLERAKTRKEGVASK
ncbi:phosphoesterase PA-phosphatase related protein [Fibrella aestuarina BUZ 2]|uniref:Phosphoesterase PA-phosphatase related protein n=1 Tax=Fibrella aestuarina BUZ 2 TaxID=1166018 RepID=I0K4E4_9BACT|nr:vanadium-dependent haloperoxidase [Fibrella aestuarina]CCG98997.1 phosphoesterase PA-phosphatase related protein [Fibrella aestuarina BUZ 2]